MLWQLKLYPPPLRKHQESQENDGQTGSQCLDKVMLVCDTRYQKNVCHQKPVPHPKHNCCNRALEHIVQANFSNFWWSSLPIRGIRSCGIQALSNLAPHLKQLHMLALWGRLWSRLGFRIWNGFGLPIPWDETVINNIFGDVKLALKHIAMNEILPTTRTT